MIFPVHKLLFSISVISLTLGLTSLLFSPQTYFFAAGFGTALLSAIVAKIAKPEV